MSQVTKSRTKMVNERYFPVHDQYLLGVNARGPYYVIYIGIDDSNEFSTIILHGVEEFLMSDFIKSNLIGNALSYEITLDNKSDVLHKFQCASIENYFKDAESTFDSYVDKSMLMFTLDCTYGAMISAICKSIVFEVQDRREHS